MDTNQALGRSELFAKMSGGTPFKSYIKSILGKVKVDYWDNFLEGPAELILVGDPKKKEDSTIIDVWTEGEDLYFRRNNRKTLEAGVILPYVRKEKVEPTERPMEQSSDEELKIIINSKFLSLNNKLNKTESVALLFRMLGLAQEMDKSEKITGAIEARISEVQANQYLPKKKKVEPEQEEV